MTTSISESEVWERVRAFAQRCLERGDAILTLRDGVPNTITKVTDGAIHRRSERGTTNKTSVTRRHVFHLWRELHGEVGGDYPVFTKALLLGAMPDVVFQRDANLVLRDASGATAGPEERG